MDYDAWKTTPPDDRGYCPACFGPVEDFDDESNERERIALCTCGWTGKESDLLSRDEARREAKEEAAIARAEARMEDDRDYRDDVT